MGNLPYQLVIAGFLIHQQYHHCIRPASELFSMHCPGMTNTPRTGWEGHHQHWRAAGQLSNKWMGFDVSFPWGFNMFSWFPVVSYVVRLENGGMVSEMLFQCWQMGVQQESNVYVSCMIQVRENSHPLCNSERSSINGGKLALCGCGGLKTIYQDRIAFLRSRRQDKIKANMLRFHRKNWEKIR